MRWFSLAVLLSLLGCATTPKAPPGEKSLFERVGVRTTAEPVPDCQPGHERALADGVVTIRPGEVICVELQANGVDVVPVAVVAKNDDTTLVVRMWSEPGSEKNTFLSLRNPLGTFLGYQATMRAHGRAGLLHTSTCPVLSKRLAIEHWPYQLDELRLGSFTALPESATVECR